MKERGREKEKRKMKKIFFETEKHFARKESNKKNEKQRKILNHDDSGAINDE